LARDGRKKPRLRTGAKVKLRGNAGGEMTPRGAILFGAGVRRNHAAAPPLLVRSPRAGGREWRGDGHSQRIRRKTVLKFDDDFVAAPLACILWADAPSAQRVRFLINSLILTDVLSGGNPVDDDAN